MLVIATFLMIAIIIPLPITAEFNTSVNEKSNVKITVTFDENDFEFEKLEGFDIIIYPDGGLTSDIGKPMLPLKNILVALPNEMRATSIRILDLVQEEIPSTYNILPVQAPQKVGQLPNKISSSYLTISESLNVYTSEKVELIGMADLAGQEIAIVTIYPFQYNPFLKTLKFLKEINFVIEVEMGYTCGDYLPNHISELEIEIHTDKVKEMVINPEDVVLQSNKDAIPNDFERGDYDYVIITKNDWVSAFQTLADWKTQKGVSANIVTTEDIYANYSGSTNQEKIRAFVQDAHSSWGATFFLLGGDSDTVPYKSVTYEGDSIPTDTYYSDYDDDWTCEVHVGRASVTGTGTGEGKIGNFINKTLTYEKDPPTTNYAKKIALFGFDLDWITDGEDCKIDIDNLYIPSDWSVTKVYDSHSGNHEDNVDTAVNSGQNLINHIDHCNEYFMGTGYTNHDWGLDTDEVDAFSNGNKQSILYSIGCWAAAFDYDNCIAEHFVRDTDGGGVGFVGNTRYGWYYMGQDDSASLRYDRYFFRSFYNQNHYKLGELFSDHKNDAYASMSQDDLNKYIFSELSLLGDPELPIWTDNPDSFDVTHPTEIQIGPSSFDVHVEDSQGSNVEDAYVCLWKGDEVYLSDYTDSDGDVTFNPSPSTGGIMKVTVTKKDFIPYESSVTVGSNSPPNEPGWENPPNGTIGVPIWVILTWDCEDPDGDPLTYDVYFGTESTPPLVSSNQTDNSYDPGTLNHGTTYYWKIIAWDDSGASNESPIWTFTTEDGPDNYPPWFSNEEPFDGETDVPVTISSLSVLIEDFEGDSFDWSIETNPNVGSNSGIGEYNGTKICSVSGLDYNTVYTWTVNATDSGSGETVSIVFTFTTADDNNPPNKPIINGPNGGLPFIPYTFTFTSTDPDLDDISYLIEWGDGQTTYWTTYQSSGSPYTESHSWNTLDTFTIRAKARDTNGAESSWSEHSITIPRNKAINKPFINFLDSHPNIFPLLRLMLQKLGL